MLEWDDYPDNNSHFLIKDGTEIAFVMCDDKCRHKRYYVRIPFYLPNILKRLEADGYGTLDEAKLAAETLTQNIDLKKDIRDSSLLQMFRQMFHIINHK